MNKYYYAGPDNKPVGPFTAEEVRKLAEEGKINDNTFLIGGGQTNWVRYADWKAAQGTAEAAEAIARKAQQMKTAISKFEFGPSIFGLLLVIVEYFVLPWRLISRSAVTLASWGRSRILPTAQSEVPVLTFITVLYRPFFHIVFTVIGWICVIVYSIRIMFHHAEPNMLMMFSGSEPSGVADGIKMLVGGLCAIYFANLLIGLIFDLISIGVQIANSLRNIEKK